MATSNGLGPAGATGKGGAIHGVGLGVSHGVVGPGKRTGKSVPIAAAGAEPNPFHMLLSVIINAKPLIIDYTTIESYITSILFLPRTSYPWVWCGIIRTMRLP